MSALPRPAFRYHNGSMRTQTLVFEVHSLDASEFDWNGRRKALPRLRRAIVGQRCRFPRHRSAEG